MENLIGYLIDLLSLLQRAIAPVAAREPRHTALVVRVWNRVGWLGRRLETLYRLWRAGRLPPARASRAGVERVPSERKKRLPQGRAWLVVLGKHDAAAAASRLQRLLERPDMTEFLAAVPAAGRILRPLCRMLGVELTPVLRLGRLEPGPVVAASDRALVGGGGGVVIRISGD